MPTINAHNHSRLSMLQWVFSLAILSGFCLLVSLPLWVYEDFKLLHQASCRYSPSSPMPRIPYLFQSIAYPPSDFIPFPSRCATCIWAWTYSCTFLPESPTIPQFPPILGISYIHFASISPSSNWSNSPPPAWRTGTRLPELWTSFGRLLKTGNNGSYLSPKWNKQPAEGILLLIRSSSFELHIVWEKRKIAVSDAGAEGDRRPNRNV